MFYSVAILCSGSRVRFGYCNTTTAVHADTVLTLRLLRAKVAAFNAWLPTLGLPTNYLTVRARV
jgi:hypothetical protein